MTPFSNNDKTVKIYSLIQQQLLANLQHPFPVNYALISPDSKILVAVGDSGQAYFYRRKAITAKSSTQERFSKYEWEVLAKPKLARGECVNDDHSFSITFSPSGQLCAISAQGGMISIFDMDIINTLADADAECYEGALVWAFKSSRSGLCGCIRSMAFSPGPWDLLAWAEDHGRAGVADVRQAFYRRQIIKLDTHAPDIQRVILEDVTDPYIKHLDMRGRLIRQYQENLHPESATSSGESLLGAPEDWLDGAASQRQRARRMGVADLDAREQSVLDTLEVTMEEVDDANNHVTHPYSVDYRSSSLRTPPESEERSPSRTHLESLIDVFRERNLQRLRGDRQHQPRRRNSVVLSQGTSSSTSGTSRLMASSTSRTRITASPARMTDADSENERMRLPPAMATHDPASNAVGAHSPPPSHNIPPSDPWHVIQSALDPSIRTPPLSTSSRLTPPRPHHDGSYMADRDAEIRRPPSEPRLTDVNSTHTSTLPNTPSSTQSRTSSRPQSNQYLLRRSVPLSDLDNERQIRRLASTTADLDQEEGLAGIRSVADDERNLRILEARILARQRLAARELDHSTQPPPAISSTLTTQRSELTGRTTVANFRLARQMMMQSARNIDRNGNWVAGEALERLLGRPGAGEANGLGGGAVARQIGVGTAGIGWSVEGRHL